VIRQFRLQRKDSPTSHRDRLSLPQRESPGITRAPLSPIQNGSATIQNQLPSTTDLQKRTSPTLQKNSPQTKDCKKRNFKLSPPLRCLPLSSPSPAPTMRSVGGQALKCPQVRSKTGSKFIKGPQKGGSVQVKRTAAAGKYGKNRNCRARAITPARPPGGGTRITPRSPGSPWGAAERRETEGGGVARRRGERRGPSSSRPRSRDSTSGPGP
jgi:hypothetical protein